MLPKFLTTQYTPEVVCDQSNILRDFQLQDLDTFCRANSDHSIKVVVLPHWYKASHPQALAEELREHYKVDSLALIDFAGNNFVSASSYGNPFIDEHVDRLAIRDGLMPSIVGKWDLSGAIKGYIVKIQELSPSKVVTREIPKAVVKEQPKTTATIQQVPRSLANIPDTNYAPNREVSPLFFLIIALALAWFIRAVFRQIMIPAPFRHDLCPKSIIIQYENRKNKFLEDHLDFIHSDYKFITNISEKDVAELNVMFGRYQDINKKWNEDHSIDNHLAVSKALDELDMVVVRLRQKESIDQIILKR